MLLLDTDAISIIQYGKGAQFESLSKMLDDAGDDVYVTVISLDEQLHGAFKEIASNDSKIRIRGYRRLRDIARDYCDRPLLDYEERADFHFQSAQGIKRPAGNQRLADRIHRTDPSSDYRHGQYRRL